MIFFPKNRTWVLPIVSAWRCSLAGSRWPRVGRGGRGSPSQCHPAPGRGAWQRPPRYREGGRAVVWFPKGTWAVPSSTRWSGLGPQASRGPGDRQHRSPGATGSAGFLFLTGCLHWLRKLWLKAGTLFSTPCVIFYYLNGLFGLLLGRWFFCHFSHSGCCCQ